MKQSLDGSLPKMCPAVRPSDQDGCTAELSLAQDPMGNSHKHHLVQNQQLNQNQTLMEQSLDGPFRKLCPAVALSHQNGRHSAVALLLKAALIQVSDYRLLGASGFLLFTCQNITHLSMLSHLAFMIYKYTYHRCKKKCCSRLFLLRLINIDNYSAFSIFKPSSNLFVLEK